uniref:USP domain-containing protein n=1 Tax=Caenorhabditis tropicalis TaxID=1561998 RepID=A0A1I7U049_9PELO
MSSSPVERGQLQKKQPRPSFFQRINSIRKKTPQTIPSDNSAQSETENNSGQGNRTFFSTIGNFVGFSLESIPGSNTPEMKAIELCKSIGWDNVSFFQLIEYINELRLSKTMLSFNPRINSYENISSFIKHYFSNDCVAAILRQFTTLQEPSVCINNGNECFGIAIIHALMSCPPFIKYVGQKQPETEIDHIIRRIVAQYLVNWHSIYITDLVSALQFEKDSREDAEEFFRRLSYAFFNSDFGKINCTKKLVCQRCNMCTLTRDENTRLMLSCNQKYTTTIQEVIKFSAREQLVERKCYVCEYPYAKIKYLYELPNVLCFSLASLWTGSSLNFIGITKNPDFSPFETEQPTESNKYRLGGVVYFRGAADERNNHYFAEVLYSTTDPKEIYLADDQRDIVRIESLSQQITEKPYFLVYYKK